MREMLNKRRNRAETGEEGFTLIELMVVVLIIGILLAIAVPTFLSAQKNAKSKAATSNLRQALSAAKTVFADVQTYDTAATPPFDQSALKAAEPSLGWNPTTSTGPDQVGWSTAGGTVLTMTVKSKLNDCFYIRDSVATTGGGTTYAKRTGAGSTACSTADTPTYSASPAAADW